MPLPVQPAISLEAIRAMIEKRPRRKQFAREPPDLLRKPSSDSGHWSVQLQFGETLCNAFSMMCADVPGTGLREGKFATWYAYLRGADEDDLRAARLWCETVGRYVVLRDCLALSFALDYDRAGGDPNQPQTRIGELRSRAKTYGEAPTSETIKAAEELVQECLSFLQAMTCYDAAEVVVAVPPSRPDRPFDLPRHLARGIAAGRKISDGSDQIATVTARQQLKNTVLGEKLQTIQGTIKVDGGSFRNRTVLLVDDLYQSGISMNYVAMEILNAGARAVFGLACEKTCRNDDNVSHSRA